MFYTYLTKSTVSLEFLSVTEKTLSKNIFFVTKTAFDL